MSPLRSLSLRCTQSLSCPLTPDREENKVLDIYSIDQYKGIVVSG